MRVTDMQSLQRKGAALRLTASCKPSGLSPRRPSVIRIHCATPTPSLGSSGSELSSDIANASSPKRTDDSASGRPGHLKPKQQQQQQQQQQAHWHWLGRVACCAVASLGALGILVSSASADNIAAASAVSAAAPATWQRRADRDTGAVAPGAMPRAQRIAEEAGGGAVPLYDTAEVPAAGAPVRWEASAPSPSQQYHSHTQHLQRQLAPSWPGLGVRDSSRVAAAASTSPLSPDSPTSSSLQFSLERPVRESAIGVASAALFAPGPGAVAAAGPSAGGGGMGQSFGSGASSHGSGSSTGSSLVPVGSSSSSSSGDRGTVTLVIGSSSGGGGSLVPSGDLASETEDRLLETARQVEARMEGLLGALAGGVPQLLAGPEAAEDVANNTAAAHALIREVWEVVDANYLDARATGFDRQRWAELRDAALAVPYRDTASAYRAVRDLLARGLSDPYCRFIGPSELEAMKKYDVSGVGLNLGTASEYVIKTGNELPAPRDPSAGDGVFVVGVSKGSIADVAGIRQGDELLEIQGESLEQSTPFRAAGLISGAAEQSAVAEEAGTSGGGGSSGGRQQRRRGGQAGDVVRVKVRHVSGQVEELGLVRPRRTLPSTVTTSISRSVVQLPEGGRGEELVGTVRLAAFNARAQADVAAAVRQLKAAGATRLVLDLRDNRGGLVTEGLEVARLFLDDDAAIVITERRDAPPDTPRASGPALTAAPLLVLVNGHTASASEIVAGALHDNCRAVLAGSRTYGKGLIQSVYELSDGSGLVITVGKYLTPRGTDIDRYGIKPDFSGVPSWTQYDSTVKACKLSAAPAVESTATVGVGGWGLQ